MQHSPFPSWMRLGAGSSKATETCLPGILPSTVSAVQSRVPGTGPLGAGVTALLVMFLQLECLQSHPEHSKQLVSPESRLARSQRKA